LVAAIAETTLGFRAQSRFADFSTGWSTRQDGYPPSFFQRLDTYIRENGFRARDVFVAIDRDHDRSISVDEMISGLNRIDFAVSGCGACEDSHVVG
jgi:hypothetical protein